VSRAARVAVLSDVHGNAPALAAVLAEVEREGPDIVVFGGDLTWGPLPDETLECVRALSVPARFVRGNADRAVLEGANQTVTERWMQERHGAAARLFLERFADHEVIDVEGLGPVRFTHGSPRTDEECITPRTPAERVREFMSGVEERVLVSAHVHIQFDREVAGIRSVNPGSVGLPYEERPDAYWALLSAVVELRRTAYDVEDAVARYRATDFPNVEQIVELLLEPRTPAEVIEDAERRVFAG
jgi:putative phosphoesterase